MSEDRPDLGAMAHRLTRAMADAEAPVLARHDLTMWEYVVLGALGTGPAPTQAQLAATSGRDQTRLIPILDALEARGLVRRSPHPEDRRRRAVALTGAGAALLAACRRAVRALEDERLAGLEARERTVFLDVLARLTDPDARGRG